MAIMPASRLGMPRLADFWKHSTKQEIVWLIREGTGESLGLFVVESMPAASAVAIIPQ